RVGCADCHVPRLAGTEGFPEAYTDMLLHAVGPSDMPGIADGEATMAQFRTPPLWGLRDTAPYMHNGSAATIEAAIAAHEGEAEASRAAFDMLDDTERARLMEFLQTR
ncbi:MAG: c-type cytochrome, partial [Myxococcales bacterium]|nr:c-type cytochrome [Myxococcales bacterium]